MHNVYTVREVNAYIASMFAQDFMMNRIYIKGEVSNVKYHTSGHIYFSLKDESGTIACVMFAGQRGGLSFRMEEGQQVIAMGSIRTYERAGSYQLYAKQIVLDGAGLLYEKFLALKRELEEMGMFAPEYKQPIPSYAKTIGVVTAPTGAAIRDIIHVSRRRNPGVQIILYPALVQGEGAAQSIVKGIQMLDGKVDVMIVGRGGGSIEELWAFNEACVARAVFECTVPVISAVGHETDTTIIDYVADLRAPTPSAAAELAVFDSHLVSRRLEEQKILYQKRMRELLAFERMKLKEKQTRFMWLGPEGKIRDYRQHLAVLEEKIPLRMEEKLRAASQVRTQLSERIQNSMASVQKEMRHAFQIRLQRMKGLSPLEKLSQGFSFVTGADGKTVRRTDDVKVGDPLWIYVTDGRIEAVAGRVEKEEEDERDR